MRQGGMSEITREEVLALLGVETKADGHRWFPVEGRVAAVRYATRRMGEGQSSDDVAEELKLNRWTLQRWLQRAHRGELETARHEKGFRQVKVTKKASGSPEGERASLSVVGACGVRVEGLDLGGVASLLKRLACLG